MKYLASKATTAVFADHDETPQDSESDEDDGIDSDDDVDVGGPGDTDTRIVDQINRDIRSWNLAAAPSV